MKSPVAGPGLVSPARRARGWSQENAARRHERVVEAFEEDRSGDLLAFLIGHPNARRLESETSRVRRELLYMLGIDPLPERTPLKAEVTGTLERAAYRVEKLVYRACPAST